MPADRFETTIIPHFFLSARNMTCVAGHMRIFGDRPGKGHIFYEYNEQAPGWALHRRWNFFFGLFSIHHVGPGKATDKPGWHITYAKLKLYREYDGIAIRWHKADTFRTRFGWNFIKGKA